MKNEQRETFKMLFVVPQLGITALTPVLLLTALGIWLKDSFQIDILVWLVIIGVASGFTAAFRFAKARAGKDDEFTRSVSGIYDKKKPPVTEENEETEDIKAEYERINAARDDF